MCHATGEARTPSLAPVHADEVAVLPRPIGRVLFDDVELFAGHRVVLPADVEVALDRVHRDGRARGVLAAVDAFGVGAGDVLVGPARDEIVALDRPLDPRELAGLSRERERRRVRRVDDRLQEVPLAAEQIGLARDVPLRAIDRRQRVDARRTEHDERHDPEPNEHAVPPEPKKFAHRCRCARTRSTSQPRTATARTPAGVRENNARTIRKTRAREKSTDFLEVAAHNRALR
jgi:hypothetical protein